MTPPRDLADAQARLDRVRDYAQLNRDLAEEHERAFQQQHEAGSSYIARIYENTAAALERIIGDKP